MKIETKQIPAKTIDVAKSVVSYVVEQVVLQPAREEYTLTLTREQLIALKTIAGWDVSVPRTVVSMRDVDQSPFAAPRVGAATEKAMQEFLREAYSALCLFQ